MKKLNEINTPAELLDNMFNIKYGWLDNDGNQHIKNLKNFRELYKISSFDEIEKTGLATCIEGTIYAKAWFDKNNIPVKLFCHRSYETEENFDKEVKMHMIILFNKKDKWFHFEHSNQPKIGIHEYCSVDEALNDITSGYAEKGDIRELTEIFDIPTGLTFKDFNKYVNTHKKYPLQIKVGHQEPRINKFK